MNPSSNNDFRVNRSIDVAWESLSMIVTRSIQLALIEPILVGLHAEV